MGFLYTYIYTYTHIQFNLQIKFSVDVQRDCICMSTSVATTQGDNALIISQDSSLWDPAK